MSTVSVTPQQIKELRERTGVGMAKCKEALEASHGDVEKAIEHLRKAGLASAVKKEGRETKEGLIASAESSLHLALVEAMAETDFVVQNDRFRQMVQTITQEAAKQAASSYEELANCTLAQGGTVDELRLQAIQALGENIQVRRLKLLSKKAGHSYGIYLHLGGKVAVIVELQGAGEEAFAKEIGMHIAASSPEYVSSEHVPQEIVDREKEIGRSQVQGKPAHVIDKIVEGKLSAYYDDNCLLRQKYIKDDQLSVGQLVEKRAKESGKPVKVVSFVRWQMGSSL